jgi:AraC-like DNA-binding protein
MSVIVYQELTKVLPSTVVSFFKKVNVFRRLKKSFSNIPENSPPEFKLSDIQISDIASRLENAFKNEKVFTNSELTITELAEEFGTNRTYISTTINYYYNQNFCSYVNRYRFSELNEILQNEKEITNKDLAIKCGFGSVDSMKRVVKLNAGMPLKEWRESVTKMEDVASE